MEPAKFKLSLERPRSVEMLHHIAHVLPGQGNSHVLAVTRAENAAVLVAQKT